MSRKLFAAPIAALILVAAAPVPSAALASNSQSQTSSSGQSSEAPAAKSERKICRNFYMSGSHVRSERLCLTRAEWKKFNETQAED